MRKASFSLLIMGEGIFLALICVGGAYYPGYDQSRQFISELGATGALTGPAVSWWGFLPSGLLITAFCLIAAFDMRKHLLSAVSLCLIAWYAADLIASALYPCDFRCVPTAAGSVQLIHDLIGGTGYIAGLVGALLAGYAARHSQAAWLFRLGVACALVGVVGLSGLAAGIEYRGLSQRILELVIMIFLLSYGWAFANGRLVGIGGKLA
ncbi:DUF998 domain-containing protein [Asticcacaulis sp. 201]|uniref:DUF998 domain-containing protein n=1 Tax=Asticcacaulis sp. 201 TaxID=3028787 RepID=UPI002915F091|nr:DUF998 domain-containing protein [Asticcacaulis sp. 201]MDV6329631.1 DUF998 domain-containing protein [Asticcacaulis sp. 201]